jgi:hypothetical protein
MHVTHHMRLPKTPIDEVGGRPVKTGFIPNQWVAAEPFSGGRSGLSGLQWSVSVIVLPVNAG